MDQQQPPQQQPPQQQPPQQQPPQQPQWTPPPQQPAGWGGPGAGGAPPRPTGVTLAAVFLIVMGVLMALGGAACGLMGGAFGSLVSQDTTGIFGAIAGMAVVGGIIILVLGIASIAAGAGSLGGSGWARWTGIVISIVFVIFGVLTILGSLSSLGQEGGVTGLVFALVIMIGYGLTAWALLRATAYFAYRR